MKTLRRKITSIVLAVLMVSSMVFSCGVVANAATDTVVAWQFDAENYGNTDLVDKAAGTANATTGTGVLQAVGTAFENTWSSNSIPSKGWSSDTYWLLTFSTLNKSGLYMSASGRSSNTGPATFDVFYSTDNENWTQFAGFTYLTKDYKDISFAKYADGALSEETSTTLALPSALEDKETVYIKMSVNPESLSVRGDAIDTSSGVSNINNIVIFTDDEVPDIIEEEDICETVTASVASGTVSKGTTVTLSTATEGATIYYSYNNGEFMAYTGAITINETATIVAYASKADFEDSAKATFTYTVETAVDPTPDPDPDPDPAPVERPQEPADLKDPIAADMLPAGALTIDEALNSVGNVVNFVGQVAYIYGTAGSNLINVCLQDVIDGKVYSILVYDRTNTYTIGDIVSVTGSITNYNGVIEAKDITSCEKLGTADAFPPLVVTAAQVNEYSEEYISRYVVIKDATIGDYGDYIDVTDATGTVQLYKGAAYPDGVVGGTTLKELTCVISTFKGTPQLRNASSADYVFEGVPTCDSVKAAPASGAIAEGTEITLSTSTAGATIMYSINGADYSVYSAPIVATSLPMTIVAYAKCDGYEDSVSKTFSYTAKEIQPPTDITDPISDDMIPEGSLNVKEANNAEDKSTVTVVGQLVARYGNQGSITSSILEDVIDGQVYGLQLFDATPDVEIGDIIQVTGQVTIYGAVKQIQNIETTTVIGKAPTMDAQAVTVRELLDNFEDYVSEYVVLENMTLGEHGGNGTTTITDASGNEIGIYRSVAYPDNASAGTVAKKVYAVFSRYNGTLQLRNGYTDEFDCGQFKYESFKLTLASWAGSAAPTEAAVNGDLLAENDYLDTSAVLTLSNGKVPKNSSSTGSMGSIGLGAGEYYQFILDASKIGKLTMSYKLRGSKTAAKNFNVMVSADGGSTFVQANTEVLSLTKDSEYESFSVALPGIASGVKDLIVRLQVADDVAINGNTIGSNASQYLQEVKFVGYPINAPELFPRVPVSSVDAGQVPYGTVVELSAYDDAKVLYSTNGIDFVDYDSAAKITLDTLPTTLYIKAYSDKTNNYSMTRTYLYEKFKCATVKGSPNGGAVKEGATLKLTCDTAGATIYYCFDYNAETKTGTWVEYDSDAKIKLDTLPCSVSAYASLSGYENSEVNTFNFTQRLNENYLIKFGQIHAHTNYSDGAGSCEDAFKHASSEVANLDFLSVTDHSNSFDNDTSCSITDGSASEEWIEGHELADKYTSDDFVCFYGYEMTWSNGLGHMNTFNTAGFQSRTQTAYKTYATALQNYYNTVKTVTDSINQFNHPGTTFGDFEDFAHYDSDIDQLITLIEVGNGEGAIGSSGYFPSYEYYTRALDRGWHVAPTNNQDNHKGLWGDSNTARTVALVDELTRENIYDAMRNYRIYATEDNDFEITYKLDDNIMGTILEKDDVGEDVTITVDMKDPTDSAIGKVEVIVNGGLSIANQTFNTNTATATFVLPSSYSYYYIKITQADGDIAVTAPVWVGEVEAVGISSISTTAPLAVKGEALDVNLALFNNESSPLEISSIEFSIDGEVIHTVDLASAGLTSIASYEAPTYSFDYTHNALGNTQIKVEVRGTLNGTDKLYTSVLQLNYVIPEMVTRVIVDGTHYNDYVTGRYSGNMGNFQAIAGAQNVKVDVVTDEITPEMLEDCALLIISTPSKNSPYASYPTGAVAQDFSEEFIKMVADYVQAGGTVIVCSMTDYYDTPGFINAEQENRLLKAIGSTMTVNSDTACDYVSNGGQPYRLYLDDYNLDSPYLEGLKEGQVFSSYRGGTVNPGNGEAIVYGHDTTYSQNWTDDEGNSLAQGTDENNFTIYPEYIEMGKTVFLATEQVGDNGGRVFVSSGVFMSNFEVKAELDNIWDLPYANKTIIENILKEVMVELPLSTIADLRAGNLGDVFRIQGYVTACTANENNKFFDAIYVQDETGGTTVFPFAELGLEIGTKMDLTGYLDEYQGDKEIQIMSYKILSDEPKKVYEPRLVTTEEATDYATSGGQLLKVQGTVSDIVYLEGTNIVSQFKVTDSSGVPATVFIDGYILSGTTGKNELYKFLADGVKVEAAGLSYLHPEGSSDVSVPVLRVRDVDEIIKLADIYKVNVHMADGVKTMTVEELAKYTPVMSGYTFLGWATSANASKPNVDISKIEEAEITDVYPVWEKIPDDVFTVTVVLDGENLILTVEQIKALTPTKDGYKFLGWATSPDATTPNVDLDKLDKNSGINTIYPVWEEIEDPIEPEFKLVVVIDGTMSTVTIDELKQLTPEKDGYKFLGWSTVENADTPNVDLSTLTEDSGIRVVYPVWEKIEDPVDPVDPIDPEEITIAVILDSGAKVMKLSELKEFTPEKDGYKFLGWSTKQNASEPDVDLSTITEDSNISVLYPVWEKIDEPNKPDDDNKPDDNKPGDNKPGDNKTDDKPTNTGDNTVAGTFVLMLLMSAAFIIATYRKRENA